MAKYIVERDCYGFQGRYWRKGEAVELSESEIPNHHFKRLDKPTEQTIEATGLTEKTVAELKALADEKGIEYSPIIKKADLIELIEKGSGE
jgi:hypothetical protein